jgi:hypothetical protein
MLCISPDDMFARNVFELRNEVLCPFLQRLDEQENAVRIDDQAQLLQSEVELVARSWVVGLVGALVGAVFGGGIGTLCHFAASNASTVANDIVLPAAIGGTAGGLVTGLSTRYGVTKFEIGLEKLYADRLAAKINEIARELSHENLGEDVTFQLKSAKKFFKRRLRVIDQCVLNRWPRP